MRHELTQFFDYKHLPPDLQEISKEFHALAELMDKVLPSNSQKTTCFLRLMEAKDCAIRAKIFRNITVS